MELNQPQTTSANADPDPLTQAPPSQPPISQDTIFRRIQSYPFHSDPSYQSGLSTILGHSSVPASPSELTTNADLVLQTQCFYFARKYGLEPIDVTEYKNFLALTASFQTQSEIPQRNGDTPPLLKPDPVPRPSAPTPNTASAASTLPVQLHSQDITSPPVSETSNVTSPPATATTQDPSPPYPTSFADIVDLITQNKPIPGIETIPDTVLEPGSSKQDRTAKRRKPWEKTTEGDQLVTESSSVAADDNKTSVETSRQTGEGVIRILQPDAIPDSGLLAKE